MKIYPQAGSSYTYTQKTINPHLGFLVGWSSILDYLFLPMVNAILTKIYLTALFPEVYPWIWVVAFVLLMTVINLFNVNFAANFNSFLVFFQMLVIVIFVALVVKGVMGGEGTGDVFSVQPFIGPHMEMSTLIYRRYNPLFFVSWGLTLSLHYRKKHRIHPKRFPGPSF